MLTQERVNELVKLAQTLKVEEMQVLMGTMVLARAQEMTIDYLNEDIDGYADQQVYQGADLWDQGSFMLEDIANEREVAAVLHKNQIPARFDIIIEKKWTARKK
jgi:hypothetical protein